MENAGPVKKAGEMSEWATVGRHQSLGRWTKALALLMSSYDLCFGAIYRKLNVPVDGVKIKIFFFKQAF